MPFKGQLPTKQKTSKTVSNTSQETTTMPQTGRRKCLEIRGREMGDKVCGRRVKRKCFIHL